jgi:hypothetical protein
MALAPQGTVLTQTAPLFVAEAFCRARLTDRLGFVYALAGDVAVHALIERAMPMA